TAVWSLTSSTQPCAVPPAAVISSTTAWTRSAPRSVTATLAPSSANRWAVARPMPLAAPVTSAVFPAMERFPVVSLGMASAYHPGRGDRRRRPGRRGTGGTGRGARGAQTGPPPGGVIERPQARGVRVGRRQRPPRAPHPRRHGLRRHVRPVRPAPRRWRLARRGVGPARPRRLRARRALLVGRRRARRAGRD